MFGVLTYAGSSVISLVFPVLASYKALAENDLTLIRPWLMYWIILGVGLAAESALRHVLFLVPFYSVIRFATLLWLVLPQTRGAVMIYTNYLEPWLKQHSDTIDRAVAGSYLRIRNLCVRRFNAVAGTSIAETPARDGDAASRPPPDDPQSFAEAAYGMFRMPVPKELSLSALVSGWRGASSTPQERQAQRNTLLEMIRTLDRARDSEGDDSDGYAVIDPVVPADKAKKTRWFW